MNAEIQQTDSVNDQHHLTIGTTILIYQINIEGISRSKNQMGRFPSPTRQRYQTYQDSEGKFR